MGKKLGYNIIGTKVREQVTPPGTPVNPPGTSGMDLVLQLRKGILNNRS